MARKPRDQEAPVTVQPEPIAEPVPEPVVSKPLPAPVPMDPPPRVQQFRVTSVPLYGRVNVKGLITRMAIGKVVDARGYDLEALKHQGVSLEPIE